AGQAERNRGPVHHRPDGTRGAWLPDERGEVAVRVGPAVRHAGELVEHRLLEAGDTQVERHVELAASALEVLVELAPDVVERRPQPADPEGAREERGPPRDAGGD